MQRAQQLNDQIDMLVQQLPQQRLQLTIQARAVLQAVRGKLSSPTALAMATISGALIGWGLYRHDSPTSSGNATSTPKLSMVVWLRRSLWTGFVAYFVRKTA